MGKAKLSVGIIVLLPIVTLANNNRGGSIKARGTIKLLKNLLDFTSDGQPVLTDGVFELPVRCATRPPI